MRRLEYECRDFSTDDALVGSHARGIAVWGELIHLIVSADVYQQDRMGITPLKNNTIIFIDTQAPETSQLPPKFVDSEPRMLRIITIQFDFFQKSHLYFFWTLAEFVIETARPFYRESVRMVISRSSIPSMSSPAASASRACVHDRKIRSSVRRSAHDETGITVESFEGIKTMRDEPFCDCIVIVENIKTASPCAYNLAKKIIHGEEFYDAAKYFRFSFFLNFPSRYALF